MENLKTIIANGDQISPRLLEQLYDPIEISEDNAYNELAAIFILLNTISIMGWMEHTSDWDLGASIILKDGTEIGIWQGYADSLTMHDNEGKELDFNRMDCQPFQKRKTKDFTLQLTKANCDTDDEDVEPISINIWDIKSISIWD